MSERQNLLNIKTPKEESIIKKEYSLNNFNDKYNLIIEIHLDHIYFKLYKSNELDLFYYKNKFDLKSIVDLLEINPDIYKNFNNILMLINEYYLNNKISLYVNNDNIDLIIKVTKNSKENEIYIHLIKTESDVNENFDAVINQINLLKKNNSLDDRLYALELLINDIRSDTSVRIEEENKNIDLLQKRILKNVNDISQSMDEINELKKRISNIKKQKENLINGKKNQ